LNLPLLGAFSFAKSGLPWQSLLMAVTMETAAFERGIRPLLDIVLLEKAEAILGFRADPALQARIDELAGKSTEGQLTEAEGEEYAGYVRANKFVAVLRRQAQQLKGLPS
jgi:hypothetical protein